MLTTAKSNHNGSNLPAAGNVGMGAAGIVSDSDLKILSHEYVGECDGIFYFRDPLRPGLLARGDEADKERLIEMQAKHPMIDAMTAAAALRARKLAMARASSGNAAASQEA